MIGPVARKTSGNIRLRLNAAGCTDDTEDVSSLDVGRFVFRRLRLRLLRHNKLLVGKPTAHRHHCDNNDENQKLPHEPQPRYQRTRGVADRRRTQQERILPTERSIRESYHKQMDGWINIQFELRSFAWSPTPAALRPPANDTAIVRNCYFDPPMCNRFPPAMMEIEPNRPFVGCDIMEESSQSLKRASLAAILAALIGWLVLICAYQAADLSSHLTALVALVTKFPS
ncbi:MAG: hypothetical protein IPK16_22195 [Anaerolineales bacterium]|nr:hypothetical protein [Anaerolineales bacterium]